MAEAKKETKTKSKKTGGVKKAATTTKRKTSQAKKTKTKKVKLVKVDEKAAVVDTTKKVEQKSRPVFEKNPVLQTSSNVRCTSFLI